MRYSQVCAEGALVTLKNPPCETYLHMFEISDTAAVGMADQLLERRKSSSRIAGKIAGIQCGISGSTYASPSE